MNRRLIVRWSRSFLGTIVVMALISWEVRRNSNHAVAAQGVGIPIIRSTAADPRAGVQREDEPLGPTAQSTDANEAGGVADESPLVDLLLGEESEAGQPDTSKSAAVAPDATSAAKGPIALPADGSLPGGIRRLKGKHLDLLTDLPSSFDVDQLPRVFDLAVDAFGKYFVAPADKTASFHATACIMKTPELFRTAGLFPSSLPDFREGFHRGPNIWLYEQPTSYYRRHLLLHEGVHAFSRLVMGGAGPPWYREGIAEFLATHHWDGVDLVCGYMPKKEDELPGWGRIHTLKREFAAGRGLMLGDILAFDEAAYREDVPYAWSWGAAAFLNGHPRYRIPFHKLTRRVTDETVLFTRMLQQAWLPEMREIDEEWQIFVVGAEYGYDFTRNAVQFQVGQPLSADQARYAVDAAKGWQSTGIRLERGQSYALRAKGTFQIARDKQPWISDANGVTLRYHGGFPLGILLGNIRPDDPAEGVCQLATPVAVGAARVLKPVESGTLYLRVNDDPSELVDNSGSIEVQVEVKEK